MMGDLKKRASFARVVNYVNNPKKARLIDSKDVRLDEQLPPSQGVCRGRRTTSRGAN